VPSTVELKENTVIVVLGASGDLAKKKTFPALFGLVSSLSLSRAQRITMAYQSLVPQQVPSKGHQDRRICSNEDGSQ
jgi:glucose-6-phosphate 1-dehydrogenase